MLTPHVRVTKSGEGIMGVMAALRRLEKTDVLVGIPAEKAPREKQEVNNAELLYIHTNGSPLRGIPARPVIEPAIQAADNKQMITDKLQAATVAVLDGQPTVAIRNLNLAGQVAVSAIKSWFTDPRNNWAPNAPSTILRKGSDKPLIDTGALRRAMTYIVEEVR